MVVFIVGIRMVVIIVGVRGYQGSQEDRMTVVRFRSFCPREVRGSVAVPNELVEPPLAIFSL